MPRKRSAIGVSTPAARRMAARASRGQSSRTSENPQQSQARLQSDRLSHRVQRASENPQQSQARLQSDRLRHRVQRASENPQQSQARLQSDRLHHRVQRASETPQQSQTRQEAYQLRYFRQRASTWTDMLNAAFHYNPALNYEQFTFLQIGHMDKQCQHCFAFKYNGERPGMCCSAGKVRIPDLPEPPEALRTLLDGSSPHSAEFMRHIRHYNNAFQMTSFGCGSRVVLPGYMPTFKVQGQVYHRIGSVLPPLNSDSRQIQPAFLQVFFIGDSSAEVATRHRNFTITKPHIVSILQDMLHQHNPYVHLFKASIEKMPSPDYKLVIKADKAPPGHHPRTFNAPTINEVAIVIVQQNCDRRDIVLSKRGSGVQRINEFHSPRHMHEYAQDCMTYVQKIRPNHIDSIICAEIPNAEVDASLFRTVTKNMIHGPCGHGYPNPGCMERGRCQKKYPRLLLAETQTDRDGYPLYRRRRPEEGGFSFVKRVRVFTIENGVQVVRMTNVTIDSSVRGPTSFAALRTINGVLCQTYKEACLHLGLLENDQQWHHCIQEAVLSESPLKIRELFAIILTCCHPTNPQDIWAQFKEPMSADILNLARQQANDGLLQLTSEMSNQALILLEQKVLQMTGFHLTKETSYDLSRLLQFVASNEPKLANVPEQKEAYDRFLSKIDSNAGGLYFLDAPGGTGKTFLINLLLTKVRSTGDIALSTATSGIAATLLHGGRTAHSTFKLPLDLTRDEVPVCNLNADSAMGEVLRQCKFIVWDECTMAHRHALEAVDITLKDCRQNQRPMGGVVLLLAGDFRQILPIIPRGTIADELHACLKASPLWSFVERLTLSTNMRAVNSGDPNSLLFSQFLLQLGSGQLNDTDGNVNFSNELVNTVVCDSLSGLKNSVFPNIGEMFNRGRANYYPWLCERAILAPRNCVVDAINAQLLKEIPGQSILYTSVDSTIDAEDCVEYTTEFLNSLEPSGMPPHHLELRVGVPIILLRNIDAPRLCNGTRLCVKRLWPHVVEATILTGCFQNEEVFVPRIPLIHDDKHSPLHFKRLQFPIRVSFAMSINKAQGQSLKMLALTWSNPVSRMGNCMLPALELWPHVVEATILTGSFQNEEVFIPRIPLIHDDKHSPLHFKRLQFPIRVSFAMSINKAQGHSLKIAGIDLRQPCFSHGQLLWPHVVEATILTGSFQNEEVFIPRIPLIHDDKHSPLHFKRLQFPIRVSFAMSINKAQGHSLKIAGIDLRQPCFSHGQLYVACSRVGSGRNL
ncbi:hypothetical protein LAZ67_5002727 [Cordylochernes scorpioides]|uniref:ATP-dependent DNA helicase n=1 Tax=Cordylochernes scorpioides TaxID=51811 RepID=A0ABY6KHQ0_9ARAC|nr:hypothetical protein LAZ67_5002727 [Cordylochernes scorpioides]